MTWHTKTIKELKIALSAKEISAQELAIYFLKRIREATDLNAFVDLNEEQTINQAKSADDLLAKACGAPLAGIPIAHKDVFVTKDWKTTAGSKILTNYMSPFDAHVVAKLGTEGAGMVCLGKLNMDEFAMGSSNENSSAGPVKNPWDISRVPGGSSGGSAVAIAAGLSPAATGTDTGGSIRQPASLCGITGIKPTYGRVSRYGMIAYASSLDQAGPMAKTAEDCALLLNAMAGHDVKDSTSIERPSEDFTSKLGKHGRKMRCCHSKVYELAYQKNILAMDWILMFEQRSKWQSNSLRKWAPNVLMFHYQKLSYLFLFITLSLQQRPQAI
jgi:aspartyl-tRNA(Asn)/glutamyl-tRNA(Gln) amidotransferase subunit A